MDAFNLIFILILVSGFFIIIFSLIKLNKHENSTPISFFDESLNQVKDTLNQVDNSIDNLNFLAEELFSQFEQKKNELMFLFQTIHNKENENSNFDISIEKYSHLEKQNMVKKDFKNSITHPMLPQIKELMKKNYSLVDIAKELNIGQGELEFIIKVGMD